MIIGRRIDELERKQDTGGARFRLLVVSFDKPEDYGREEAAAIMRDAGEHGPLQSGERRIILAGGPAGRWIETSDGTRWQHPDGTTTDDPTGAWNGERLN